MTAPLVVPLDGSAAAERAVCYAAAIARRTGAPLELVRVATPDFGDSWIWSVRGSQREADVARSREFAAAYLAGVAERVGELDGVVRVRTVVLEAPVERALVGHARRTGGLVVMTMRGYGTSGLGGLGPVPDRVVRWSGVPVILVPPEGNPDGANGARGRGWSCERILLLDGTGAEEGPVRHVVDTLAGAFGSRVALAGTTSITRILAMSVELDADLIAVGVPRPDVGVLRYGSLASRLLRQTPVPVLLSCGKSVAWGPGGARDRAAATPVPAA